MGERRDSELRFWNLMIRGERKSQSANKKCEERTGGCEPYLFDEVDHENRNFGFLVETLRCCEVTDELDMEL